MPSPSQASLLLVESARYALLRRIAFAMRHQMVVHLQPIGMVTELMERRLRAPEPNLAQVHEGMGKVHTLSKAAVQSSLDVITWLAPDPGAATSLEAGVEECMALLRSNFSFRGFNVVDELGAAPLSVSRAAVRMSLPACLLALTDDSDPPAKVAITGHADDDQGVLEIVVEPLDGDPGFTTDATYRKLGWAEVEAVVRSEGVEFERIPDGVRLTFPFQPPPAPKAGAGPA